MIVCQINDWVTNGWFFFFLSFFKRGMWGWGGGRGSESSPGIDQNEWKCFKCYYNLLCDKFQVAFCHSLGHTRMDSGPFYEDIAVPNKKGRDPSWKLDSRPSNTPLTPAKCEIWGGGAQQNASNNDDAIFRKWVFPPPSSYTSHCPQIPRLLFYDECYLIQL